MNAAECAGGFIRALLGCQWSAATVLTKVVAPTAPVQRAALVELYIATDGTAWTNRTGWQNHASGSDPCDNGWAAIVCDGGSGVLNRNV
jgi:hypothetical protein